MDLPSFVQIEPVGQCNLRCKMCPIQFRRDGPPYGPLAFIDFDVYTRLIDGFPNLRELHLQGLGEPMMHPRFFDMVAYAAGKGIQVSTSSNLTLLSERRAHLCVSSGLAYLHASLDGATAETYEEIRVRAHFDRVLRNLRRLIEARRQAASELPRIRLVAVAMRRNLHELPALVHLAHEHSVDSLFVQHLCHDFTEASLPAHYRPMREFVERETLLNEPPARVEYYFGKTQEAARELGITLRLPRTVPRTYPPGTPGRSRCDWPWRGTYLSYRGEAMPCCMVGTPDRINFGNMAEEGITNVWNNDAYSTFRTALASDTAPEICRSCALYRGTF